MSVDRERDYLTVQDAQRAAETFAAGLGHAPGPWGPAKVYRQFIFTRTECACGLPAYITAYQIGLDPTPHYTCDGGATRRRCNIQPQSNPTGQMPLLDAGRQRDPAEAVEDVILRRAH